MITGDLVYPHALVAADRYARHFHPDPLTAAPTRHFAVLTCMDARLDLFRLLGLEVGDAHIVRNAGGRATDDAVRSLVLSSHRLGTREFAVIHHTGCGLFGVTNAELNQQLAAATGVDSAWLDFHPFADLDESIRDDVEQIRTCALLPQDSVVWGAIYDVATALLHVVVPPTGLASHPITTASQLHHGR